MLWHTTGACENFCQLRGHKSAVTDLAWAKDSEILYSASADKTLGLWDLETGRRVRRLAGHDGYINTMDITKRGIDMIVSGADDGWINVSIRVRTCDGSNADKKRSYGIRAAQSQRSRSRTTPQ